MSTQIQSFDLSPILIQAGYGTPNHISSIGSEYTDLLTGKKYSNMDGIVSWIQLGSGIGGAFSGGTVSGATIFTSGLSANTFSATTYLGLPSVFKYNIGGLPVSGITGDVYRGDSISLTGATPYFGTSTSLTSSFGTTFGHIGAGTTSTGFIQMLSDNHNGGFANVFIGLITGATTSEAAFNFHAIKSLSYDSFSDSNRLLFSFSNGYLSATRVFNIGTDYIQMPKYLTSRIDTGSTSNYLSTDATGKILSKPLSGLTSSTFSGGTVTGPTTFTNTLSASTYLGLPLDIYVTGGTYNAGTATFTNNTGGTFDVSGFYISGGCPTTTTLIASNSGSFTQTSGLESSIYYIGDSTCGWNSCNLNVLSNIDKSRLDPINIRNLNCGIPLPMDLIEGDIITLCGMAFCPDARDGDAFNTAMEIFACDSFNRDSSAFDITNILNNGSDLFRNGYTCFSLKYQLVKGDILNQCNDLIVIGFRGDFIVDSYVNLTWTLNITRNCS